jgi:hemolysin activation/secretion protein
MERRSGSLSGLAWAVVAVSCAFSFPALAQVTPGQVGDTLRPPPEIKDAPEPVVETQRAEPDDSAKPDSGPTVVVKQFQFSGNQLYSALELEAVVAGYLNRPVSLIDIFAAADSVASHYAKDGYTLASVAVPPQKISDGVVILEISEGRIGQISLEQPADRSPDRVQKFLSVAPGDLYQSRELEKGLLQLNELPGLTARALVKPGEAVGTTDIVIRTAENPVTGSLWTDNYGRKSIGENRFGTSVNLNNPLGFDDQIQLLALVSSASSLTYGFAGYNFPLGFGGARASLSYGYADFEVRDVPGLTGDSKNARLGIEYPYLRSARELLKLTAAVFDTRTSTDLQGGAPIPGTSITVLEVGATYNRFHSNAAVTQLSAVVSSNFEEQERADLSPPVGADVDGKQMARVEIDAIHFLPLGAGFAASGRVNAAWSPDPLSDPQAYSIGGPQSIRGFPASEVRGDRGYFTQLTFMRRSTIGALAFTPRLFLDNGEVDLVEPLPGQTGGDLTSYGLGFDLDYRQMNFKLDVSEPGGNRIDPADGRPFSTRVFGSLLIKF